MKALFDKWYTIITTTQFTESQKASFLADCNTLNINPDDFVRELYTLYMTKQGMDIKRDITTGN